MFTKEQIRAIYSQRAGHYDRWVEVFPLLGARLGRYRREAVAALRLSAGATVIELGCGTGLNFALLEAAVGPEGCIIGVDLTPAMLAVAHRRVERHGWKNVQLVLSDLGDYHVPTGPDGILSTFALTLAPEYDRVIRRAADVLTAGRFALLDLKLPATWPRPLVRLAAWANRPFAVTLDLGGRHPWESLEQALRLVSFREFYCGAVYLAVGEPRRTKGREPAAGTAP